MTYSSSLVGLQADVSTFSSALYPPLPPLPNPAPLCVATQCTQALSDSAQEELQYSQEMCVDK